MPATLSAIMWNNTSAKNNFFMSASTRSTSSSSACPSVGNQDRDYCVYIDYYSENVVTSFKKGISTRLTRRLLQVKLKNVARKGCNLNINAVALGPCRSVCGGSWLPPSFPHDVSN